ncbi:uncharacterized protein LOC135146287 [Zophobas morio]|uniref:uncharacterized protein LOC135146287 n=1 Tax=Zophobas morio TaxID=2755281 RepID=UPI003083A86D
METVCADLYRARFIRGFCHLYTGQEAVATGIEAILKPQDSVITSYRCHAFVYTRGESIKDIISELLGRKNGVSKGKGGSMHMYTRNFYGGNGIVGAQVPIGTGIAFAHKYKGDDGVCFDLYGDGAANQGQVFESFNMAKLWNLPVIFVCENNKYGMGTSQERSSASFAYYKRGDYIPGLQVDGMDVLAVREASQFCANFCRSGKGPILMETVTYRFGGHSMSDPGTTYRTRDEVQQMRISKDPILSLKEKLLGVGIITETYFNELQNTIKKEVETAVEEAKASEEPETDALFQDVYVKYLDSEIRGCDAFSYHSISS